MPIHVKDTVNSHFQVRLDAIQCDLLNPFLHRCRGAVDLLLFNPPYVETEDLESALDAELVTTLISPDQLPLRRHQI